MYKHLDLHKFVTDGSPNCKNFRYFMYSAQCAVLNCKIYGCDISFSNLSFHSVVKLDDTVFHGQPHPFSDFQTSYVIVSLHALNAYVVYPSRVKCDLPVESNLRGVNALPDRTVKFVQFHLGGEPLAARRKEL